MRRVNLPLASVSERGTLHLTRVLPSRLLYAMAASNPWTSSRIKGLRQRAELPQARMAERLGVELAVYQAWEAGTEAPTAEGAARLRALAGAETTRVLPVFRRELHDVLAAGTGGALLGWDRTMGCYRCYPADALPSGIEILAVFSDAAGLEAALA